MRINRGDIYYIQRGGVVPNPAAMKFRKIGQG